MARLITVILTLTLVLTILLYHFFNVLTMPIITILLLFTVISYFVQLYTTHRKK
ncbi:hypothetical protein NIE88_12910 [Sporolactobacillus shoreicorticis]|uniref:Uncharacterized protein n=1 Tax=Sporolactobacillus shoreicorticis TaxID=1923877 RepID=A0ABW5S560_9BACL|nr:hypothetical protein [Sporolactobacillus shoreicorticis]MCO7126665.1 hypothetical protein [Sporolactobacillus shoreicorticis]